MKRQPTNRYDAAVAGTSFRKEAAAFTTIADVLEGRPKEEACAIMAGVCSVLGFYDQAETFIDLARHWRMVTDQAAELDAAEPVAVLEGA